MRRYMMYFGNLFVFFFVQTFSSLVCSVEMVYKSTEDIMNLFYCNAWQTTFKNLSVLFVVAINFHSRALFV